VFSALSGLPSDPRLRCSPGRTQVSSQRWRRCHGSVAAVVEHAQSAPAVVSSPGVAAYGACGSRAPFLGELLSAGDRAAGHAVDQPAPGALADRQLCAESAVGRRVDDERRAIGAELDGTHAAVGEVGQLLRGRLRAQPRDELLSRNPLIHASRRGLAAAELA
jgi:hypothetical protein